MTEPRFKDGTPIPDDEVAHKPDTQKHYSDASRQRLLVLKEKLQGPHERFSFKHLDQVDVVNEDGSRERLDRHIARKKRSEPL